jgi:hypothetical protein
MIDIQEEIKDALEETASILLIEDFETFKSGGKSKFVDKWEMIDEGNPCDTSFTDIKELIKDELKGMPKSEIDKIRTKAMERLKKLESEVI